MRIVVPVKPVPETSGDQPLDPATGRVDRTATVLNPVDEFAVEEAVRLKEAHGAEVTALMVGPAGAEETLRSAVAYGLDAAVLVSDHAIAGSDALGTARVIAAALRQRGFDLVVFGNQSTEARTCLVPAAVAELLGLPGLTYARRLEVEDDTVVVHREHPEGWDVVTSSLPAVVSVVEAINEPRYPAFDGILASQQMAVDVRSLADLALADPGEHGIGAEHAAARLLGARPRPPREPGPVVEDDGQGSAATRLADWLEERRLL